MRLFLPGCKKVTDSEHFEVYHLMFGVRLHQNLTDVCGDVGSFIKEGFEESFYFFYLVQHTRDRPTPEDPSSADLFYTICCSARSVSCICYPTTI